MAPCSRFRETTASLFTLCPHRQGVLLWIAHGLLYRAYTLTLTCVRTAVQAKWIMNAVEKYVTVFVALLKEDQEGAQLKRPVILGDVAPVLAWLLPDTEVTGPLFTSVCSLLSLSLLLLPLLSLLLAAAGCCSLLLLVKPSVNTR
jgi:hypothetical protein